MVDKTYELANAPIQTKVKENIPVSISYQEERKQTVTLASKERELRRLNEVIAEREQEKVVLEKEIVEIKKVVGLNDEDVSVVE